MKCMHAICARLALATVAAAVAGCASEPITAGTSLAGGLFYATAEVSIFTGRTFTNALGLGYVTVPPRAADPVLPSFLK